jgi:predicted signal transduction protein with EAL and GGDEF domain
MLLPRSQGSRTTLVMSPGFLVTVAILTAVCIFGFVRVQQMNGDLRSAAQGRSGKISLIEDMQSLTRTVVNEVFLIYSHKTAVPQDRLLHSMDESAVGFMRAAKEMGFKFALDDFGTGMSSFAYLKHLPVDFVKIDGTFMRDVVRSNVDHEIVDAIIRISRAMKIETIAEYVGDEQTMALLARLGVDYAQGLRYTNRRRSKSTSSPA